MCVEKQANKSYLTGGMHAVAQVAWQREGNINGAFVLTSVNQPADMIQALFACRLMIISASIKLLVESFLVLVVSANTPHDGLNHLPGLCWR